MVVDNTRELLKEVKLLEWGKCPPESLDLLKQLLKLLSTYSVEDFCIELTYFGNSVAKNIEVQARKALLGASKPYPLLQVGDMEEEVKMVYQLFCKLAESVGRSYYFVTMSFPFFSEYNYIFTSKEKK